MTESCSVAVVGSGAAGLMAAIGASASPECVLITDGQLGRSNSIMAQGGLQLPLPSRESRQMFFEDIVRSARTELEPALVRNFVAHVPETVACLEAWGLELDRDERGDLIRRSAGGLSEPRIVSVRDQIGPAIVKVLRRRLGACDVAVLQNTQVTDLRPNGRDFLLTLRGEESGPHTLRARAVVVCTGGLAYREAQRRGQRTTNPRNENHVLYDVLCRLGLTQVHADYFQYQPFGIVSAEAGGETGKAVPESITGFGVRLLDRFGRDICDARQDRLALTNAIFAAADAGRAVRLDDGSPAVWLTLGDIDPATLARVFPKVHQHLERAGLVGESILVYPFLHYYLGGLKIDIRCASEVPGLFLAGEIAGGIHGRNRLMGNGITDSLVHGRIAGRTAREYAAGIAS